MRAIGKTDCTALGWPRALTKLGYYSRSQAPELIRAGRVSLNSKVRRDPEQAVNLGHDHIQVDGNPVSKQEKST